MPSFSRSSSSRLATWHPDLQELFNEVIKHRDCTVICGSRTLEEQKENVRRGVSKTLNSKQVVGEGIRDVSHAVDVMPYFNWRKPTIDWQDRESISHFAGFVLGVAAILLEDGTIDHEITWGGDWDGDGVSAGWYDGPHFELVLDDGLV